VLNSNTCLKIFLRNYQTAGNISLSGEPKVYYEEFDIYEQMQKRR